MPRYFFHFAKRIVNDSEGVELTGPREAHAHAFRLMQQMRIELPSAHEWRIEVSDKAGNSIFVLPSRSPLLKVV